MLVFQAPGIQLADPDPWRQGEIPGSLPQLFGAIALALIPRYYKQAPC